MKIEDGLGTAEVGGGGFLVIVASGTAPAVDMWGVFTCCQPHGLDALGTLHKNAELRARGKTDLHPSASMVCLAMYPNLVD